MTVAQCRVEQQNQRYILHSPALAYHLDAATALRGVSWTNHFTGQTLDLGHGLELEADLDRADARIGISGWRGMISSREPAAPDDEPGFRAGFFQAWLDDVAWEGVSSPAEHGHNAGAEQGSQFYWVRTHIFLPPSCANLPLSLVLGGWGLFDFRYMRVFLNGHAIGTREVAQRWHTPGCFPIGAGTSPHRYLRFGQDNVVALQLSGYIARTERLDELDPRCGRELYHTVWPPQFEQYIVAGVPSTTPEWEVTSAYVAEEGERAEFVCSLKANSAELTAQVRYRWNAEQPVLLRQVTIDNAGRANERLLNLRLGSYQTAGETTTGEQGFPVYIDQAYWMAVAHPSGWATGQHGQVELRQFPAALLTPDTAFQSMETVLGVSPSGEARQAFLRHVRSRMRRTVAGHDRAYAIFEGLGSWDYDIATAPGPYAEVVSQEASDAVLLPNLRAMVEGAADAGYHFDIYALEMWADYHGDLTRFDPVRFPDGLANINTELAKVGTVPGLWIDSSMAAWSIGGNPVVSRSFTHDPGYGSSRPTFCRATEPIRSMYTTAFLHHFEQNGVRMVKTDNLTALCYNPTHEHFPGVYSTEAIQSAVVETLRQWDTACPDLFMMLYWGYRSPWWLLHGDTIFEPGLFIEAAHPGSSPTLFVRDSVIQGLDQAQWWAEDIPALGKDSLGVWLSSWKWNSSIGAERWQEAFVMDLCRGSLLAQPWSDGPWLDPPQRLQMAEFIALLRAQPGCFGNPRFIIGNPWKNEPYGYCCTEGTRAFLALNNCSWTDTAFHLELNPSWGLPAGSAWQIYRWYPDPAHLTQVSTTEQVMLALRPFQIVLLEVVQAGAEPSLGRAFESRPLLHSFEEASCDVAVDAAPADDVEPLRVPREDNPRAHGAPLPEKRVLQLSGRIPANAQGGLLVVRAELRQGDAAFVLDDIGEYFAVQGLVEGVEASTSPVVRNRSYPAPWQAWRIAVDRCVEPQSFCLTLTTMLPDDVELVYGGTFIPSSPL